MNGFSSFIDQTLGHGNNDGDEYFTYVDHLMTLGALPMVLKSTIELDLLGIIARAGPSCLLTSAEIVAQLPTKNPEVAASMVDRMLRLLAAYSVVTCSRTGDGHSQRRYGLTPAAKYLVPDEDGVSLAPLILATQHKVYNDSWYKLNDAVIEGKVPFDMAHGVNVFEYNASNRGFNEVFNAKCFNYTTVLVKKMFKRYEGFKDIKSLVDVGGGVGHTIHAIVSQYLSIKGINFDLPHVIRDALPHPGVEHVSGDMFQSVPEGDAIFMKWVMHDWDDGHCLKLLKNCYTSLPKKGKVIIVENLLTNEVESTVAAKSVYQMDVFVMAEMRAGKERTREEFIALANAAGFVEVKFPCCVCNFWMIELWK